MFKNIICIIPITKVSWKQGVQLLDKLAFAANPLDKWFCFYHL